VKVGLIDDRSAEQEGGAGKKKGKGPGQRPFGEQAAIYSNRAAGVLRSYSCFINLVFVCRYSLVKPVT
jgi:hypothetical protein